MKSKKDKSEFYSQMRKLVGTVIEDNSIVDILTICNMYPESEFDNFSFKNKWIDVFGGGIEIRRLQGSTIFNTFFSIKRPLNIDLYSGLSFDNILKITKSICIFNGIDEDSDEKIIMYNCYCVDDKIRSFIKYKSDFKRCSPILLGYDNLYELYRNRNINYNYNKNSKIVLPTKEQVIYFSNYPIDSILSNKLY